LRLPRIASEQLGGATGVEPTATALGLDLTDRMLGL